MANQEVIQDKIERYVLGELSEADAKAFALEIEADAQLAEAVADFRSFRADLQAMDEADFMGKMKAMAGEIQAESASDQHEPPPSSEPAPNPSFLRRRWPYAVAAVLLLLLIPTLMLLRGGDDALFNEYFSPYSDVATGRDSDDPAFLAAMEAYNAADYSAALPHFNQFLSAAPTDQDGLFYGGIAELAAGSPAIAIQRLEQLRGRQGIFQTAATWYIALAQLKSGSRHRARSMLEELVATPNSYEERARELLGKL
jgi:hypothetical protein